MTAERVATILEAIGDHPRRVEVVGDGPLASALRDAVGAMDAADAPGTIIDTTGAAAALERALERVRDLGTVVLAGPPPEAGVDLDVYADLHLRGLTLIGVPS